MKWISAAILVQIQTIPACPLVVDPIKAVVVDYVDGVVFAEIFSELFPEFVAGFPPPSLACNPLASSTFAAVSPSVVSNARAAAICAEIL